MQALEQEVKSATLKRGAAGKEQDTSQETDQSDSEGTYTPWHCCVG